MTDLIARLESASEGSRELSDEVLEAFGWTHDRTTHTSLSPDGTRYGYDMPYSRPPHPSRSLDDALGLAPDDNAAIEALQWAIMATAGDDNRRSKFPRFVCASILRAKEADHAR